jgi:hypothetical protein
MGKSSINGKIIYKWRLITDIPGDSKHSVLPSAMAFVGHSAWSDQLP